MRSPCARGSFVGVGVWVGVHGGVSTCSYLGWVHDDMFVLARTDGQQSARRWWPHDSGLDERFSYTDMTLKRSQGGIISLVSLVEVLSMFWIRKIDRKLMSS